MICRSYSAGIFGVEGFLITVEAHVGLGIPGLALVGQATGAMNEARHRVKTALSHCGHDIHPRKQVVNLAPAERQKDSPGLDLAVAAALLAGHDVIPAEMVERCMFWGELALDGAIRPVGGALIVADTAREHGFDTLVLSHGNAAEAQMIPGLKIIVVRNLEQMIRHFRAEGVIEPLEFVQSDTMYPQASLAEDMLDIRGLVAARVGVAVMVAGGHNLLLHGPPGVGKTMLARRASGLFPLLETESALEVTKIHSVANRSMIVGLNRQAPIRTPHHTVSRAGLLGGGTPPHPGEVSLAHRGLLFLDEMPEFSRACLEGLREPLEDGSVSLVRAKFAVRFPARFQLMGAMNPCPCGYLGHPERSCTDNAASIERYQKKLSGPLLDRMDLSISVQPVASKELAAKPQGDSSEVIRRRIESAYERQLRRFSEVDWNRNAQIPAHQGHLDRWCAMTPKAASLFERIAESRHLSPRAQHRLRRVARTISDLQCPDAELTSPLSIEHIAQASHLRQLPGLSSDH